MKLIDLLIRELPENGGWPEGATEFHRHGILEFDAYFYGKGGGQIGESVAVPSLTSYCGDANGETVTREQYESALAASRRAEWDGVGLPPVGSMVELMDDSHSSTWEKATIKFYGDAFAVWDVNGREESNSLCHVRVRSVRSESERKREEAIKEMMECSAVLVEATAGLIYDAIAAGRIPHITLK